MFQPKKINPSPFLQPEHKKSATPASHDLYGALQSPSGTKKVLLGKTFFPIRALGSTATLPHLNNIQSPIRQQLTHLNHLQNPHRNTPSRSIQIKRQITDHCVRRSQILTEIRKQTLRIHTRINPKNGVGLVRCFVLRLGFQIKIQRSRGGVIDFLVADRLSTRDVLVRIRGFGVSFAIILLPVVGAITRSRLNEGRQLYAG